MIRLAVSVGCPAGIGPEVAALAAYELRMRRGLQTLLIGDRATLQKAWNLHALAPAALHFVRALDAPIPVGCAGAYALPGLKLGAAAWLGPTAAGGAAQLRYVDMALLAVTSGAAHAMVTGPVSKHAVVLGGATTFRGHTEYLQSALGAREVVMAFASKRLTTALVTTHLPLAKVARAITPARVAAATFWLGHHLLQRGFVRPVIAVAGLNPHAGEGGLLGNEERHIEVGMQHARTRLTAAGLDVEIVGPVPAETAFRVAVTGRYAGVVAMYHDQATIPMKLASFGEAVNVSLGLPQIRTSVDHGTGYDRAWRGTASAEGMIAAMKLAHQLARVAR